MPTARTRRSPVGALALRNALSGLLFSMEKGEREVKSATDAGRGFHTVPPWKRQMAGRMRTSRARRVAGKPPFFLKTALLVTADGLAAPPRGLGIPFDTWCAHATPVSVLLRHTLPPSAYASLWEVSPRAKRREPLCTPVRGTGSACEVTFSLPVARSHCRWRQGCENPAPLAGLTRRQSPSRAVIQVRPGKDMPCLAPLFLSFSTPAPPLQLASGRASLLTCSHTNPRPGTGFWATGRRLCIKNPVVGCPCGSVG